MSIVDLEMLCRALGAILLATVLRSTVLFLASALVIVLFRVRSAEIGHFIWRRVLYGLLLLPVLQLATPPIKQRPQVLDSFEIALSHFPQKVTLAATVPFKPAHTRRTFPWAISLAALYLLVTAALLVRFGLGVFRLRKMVRSGEPVTELGKGFPSGTHVLVSPQVRIPMAAGICRVSILLPPSWMLWSPGKLQAVLLHENAHAQRKDPATAFLASLALCFFWVHPLAYWLRRRLTILAEEACDETALEHITPEQYAQTLLEFSTDVARTGSCLVGTSTVAVSRSLMKKRIERIFSTQRCTRKNSGLTRILLIGAFFPVLYVTAALQTQAPLGFPERHTISVGSREQAARQELNLEQNPKDLSLRGALMMFYANERDDVEFTKHLLWAIDHHPENSIAAMRVYSSKFDRLLRPVNISLAEHTRVFENYERAKASWERALAAHSDSASVIYHAGLFLQREDPGRALTLFARAKSIASTDPGVQEGCLDAIAAIHSAAVISGITGDMTLTPDLANALRNELDSSRDAAFVSRVGTKIVQSGDDRLTQTGLALLRRAIELEPDNPKWKEALESAKAEPIRRRNRLALSQRRNN